MTTDPDHDRADHDRADDPRVDDVTGAPDALTGAPPGTDEIAAADPGHEGPEADPYELRSGVETSPSDDDPGSMLGR